MQSISPKELLSNMFGRRGKENNSSSKEKEKSSGDEKHSLLAFGLGRRNVRTNIKSFVKRLQSTLQESRTVERVLQPTTRIKEAEGSSEKADRRIKQASEVIGVVNQPGFEHYVKMMRRIEGDSYFSLRTPSSMKKDDLSLEYTVGFHAGVLSVIDDFFQVERTARSVVQKEKQRIENEANK